MPTRPHVHALFLLTLTGALSTTARERPRIIQRPYELTESVVKWDTYEISRSGEQDISMLDHWTSAPLDKLLVRKIFDGERDFRLYLLQNGLAKLKRGVIYPAVLSVAQEQAINLEQGMWSKLTPPLPPKRSNQRSLDSPTLSFFLRRDTLWGLTGILFSAFFGVQWWRWRDRHKLRLIFLGEPSSGKTWLWSRLLQRNISLEKLKTITISASKKNQQSRNHDNGKI